ncbi:hypothetical protein [Actinoallomurus rhizosphaericola]|uniref:hypothetical protein n=1 Tax=Actinoallomurus rhizosphaericola TaxID=2952536 RepID=UPI003872AA14
MASRSPSPRQGGNAVRRHHGECPGHAARTVVRHAHAVGYGTVLSARCGETEDDWLADLAVGRCTGQIEVVPRCAPSAPPSGTVCCGSRPHRGPAPSTSEQRLYFSPSVARN